MPSQIPIHTETSWQEHLSSLITDPDILLDQLGLEAAQLGLAAQGLRDFPLRVPRPYLARMERGNPRDPLLLQVLPQGEEDHEVAGFSDDPLGESHSNPVPGLLHKYAGRVLLMPTASCAIHCRYCFRRHFPYQDNIPSRAQWQQALDYLRDTPAIHEVILSGGDPLAVPDRHLDWLLGELERIPHLHTLRFHTRLPIMIPGRITDTLTRRLAASRLHGVMVIHANHAREFDADVDRACARLREAGVMLLNQSVLLRGINDDAETLAALSRRLLAAGVMPYYLHLLDRTRGTAHFDVPHERGRALIEALRARLPGYLVPRLVREEPGADAKTPA